MFENIRGAAADGWMRAWPTGACTDRWESKESCYPTIIIISITTVLPLATNRKAGRGQSLIVQRFLPDTYKR